MNDPYLLNICEIVLVVVSVIAFLISGIGLVALILAIVAACNKSKCLAISAIVIGAVCIVLAIVFWIVLIVLVSRKATLETKYCSVLATACCSGTYISSSYGYNLFTCITRASSSKCVADPFSYSVTAYCIGSYYADYSSIYCSGNSQCSGTANDQTPSVCSQCKQSIDCYYKYSNVSVTVSSTSSSNNYCK